MTDKVFIDTNIFVYGALSDPQTLGKRRIVVNFLKELSDEVIISTQIVNEFYITLLRNQIEDKLIQEKVLGIIDSVELKAITLETIQLAWTLLPKYNLSYWDSLIVASALENGCKILYSENMHPNLVIDDKLQIINPINLP